MASCKKYNTYFYNEFLYFTAGWCQSWWNTLTVFVVFTLLILFVLFGFASKDFDKNIQMTELLLELGNAGLSNIHDSLYSRWFCCRYKIRLRNIVN